MKKVALFHPWIKSRGGAERVILDILKYSKHEVDVYTWVYDSKNTFEEFENFKINTIAPKIANRISRLYILRGLFFPISLFSKIPLKEYDKLLISSGGLAELITLRNYEKGKNYAYIHTILRAAYHDDVEWNLKNRYKKSPYKLLYKFAVNIYRILEKISWKRIDFAIFNSELSRNRAEKHNLLENKKTEIIYPPVNVERFSGLEMRKGDYFLYVARFGKAKRQKELIEAWDRFVKKHPGEKLILVGNKENKKYFEEVERMSNNTKNVRIYSDVSDEELSKLYTNCKAVLSISFMEDFGIVPFEAMSIGKPLIITGKGGYMDLIKKHYKNNFVVIEEGENFANNILNSLIEFEKRKISPKKTKIKELDSRSYVKKIDRILEK